jgi:penicillin amidase
MTTLGARVEIIRDRAGVPHVFAVSTDDLYCGLGYAMARDRLWQMDRLRRRALGRQAEVLGAAYVESDLLHRAVGIPAIARHEAELLDAQTRGILESFVAGINRFIAENRLPPEFKLLAYEPEPFSVSDSIAILRGEWWSLNGRLQTLTIAEAANELPADLREAFLTPEAPEHRIVSSNGSPLGGNTGMSDPTGSNNWAVAGWRTKSGQAVLCSDPHQPFWVPASWYEYVLNGPEDNVGGAGHPGVPGLVFGTNGTVAWGITNNASSTRDLYREEVHPHDPNLYRDGQTWRRFDDRVEEV